MTNTEIILLWLSIDKNRSRLKKLEVNKNDLILLNYLANIIHIGDDKVYVINDNYYLIKEV